MLHNSGNSKPRPFIRTFRFIHSPVPHARREVIIQRFCGQFKIDSSRQCIHGAFQRIKLTGRDRTPGQLFPLESDGSAVDDFSKAGATAKVRISKTEGLAAQVLAEDAPTTVTHITQAMLAAAVSAS